jgi:hypothetical protein
MIYSKVLDINTWILTAIIMLLVVYPKMTNFVLQISKLYHVFALLLSRRMV